MSLVPTYVRATDGKLYKNPILRGEGWFICFDDEDPVELVLDIEHQLIPEVLLSTLGIKHTPLVCNGFSGRLFSKRGFKFRDATSWFFELKNRIPVKYISEHEGVIERSRIHQGVIYDPEPEQKNI